MATNREFFGWIAYTIYEHAKPIKVGITIKPTVSLSIRELSQLIDELTRVKDQMVEGGGDGK